mgnify:CR=1 FL=1
MIFKMMKPSNLKTNFDIQKYFLGPNIFFADFLKSFLDANCSNLDIETVPENFHEDERAFLVVYHSFISFIKKDRGFKLTKRQIIKS